MTKQELVTMAMVRKATNAGPQLKRLKQVTDPGQQKSLQLLIDAKADIDAVDTDGRRSRRAEQAMAIAC